LTLPAKLAKPVGPSACPASPTRDRPEKVSLERDMPDPTFRIPRPPVSGL